MIDLVDMETGRVVPDDTVGEVWVSGPNVAQGYWDAPVDTARTFGATHPGSTARFLRTGDLAFRHDGEIFLVGRAADMIVLGGQNYHANDIEYAAESADPALRSGRGASFVLDEYGGTAGLVTFDDLLRNLQGDRASARELTAAFLEAFLLGFEVECKVCEAIHPDHYRRGYHSSGTIGTFGAAVAAAKLLGLDRPQTVYHRPRSLTGHRARVSALRSQTSRFRFPSVTRLGVGPARRATTGFGPSRARRA